MKHTEHPTLTFKIEARIAYHLLDGLRRQKKYYETEMEVNRERKLKAFERSAKNNAEVIEIMIQTIKNQAILQGDVI